MLWTIAVILFVLWAVGLVTSYTIGGYIHILAYRGGDRRPHSGDPGRRVL